MNRTIIIDGSMSMSGAPLENAIAHAQAFEEGGVRVVVLGGGAVAWDGTVRSMSNEALQKLLAGPELSRGMMEVMDVADTSMTTILYTDGYLEDIDAVLHIMAQSGSRQGNVVRIDVSTLDDERAERHIRDIASNSRANGMAVLPVPDRSTWEPAPLAGIRNALRHEIAHANAVMSDFIGSFVEDADHALETSTRVYKATARRTAASRLMQSLDAIGTTVQGGNQALVTFDYVLGMWERTVSEAAAQVASTSSSETANIMRRASFEAAWWAIGLLKQRR